MPAPTLMEVRPCAEGSDNSVAAADDDEAVMPDAGATVVAAMDAERTGAATGAAAPAATGTAAARALVGAKAVEDALTAGVDAAAGGCDSADCVKRAIRLFLAVDGARPL